MLLLAALVLGCSAHDDDTGIVQFWTTTERECKDGGMIGTVPGTATVVSVQCCRLLDEESYCRTTEYYTRDTGSAWSIGSVSCDCNEETLLVTYYVEI